MFKQMLVAAALAAAATLAAAPAQATDCSPVKPAFQFGAPVGFIGGIGAGALVGALAGTINANKPGCRFGHEVKSEHQAHYVPQQGAWQDPDKLIKKHPAGKKVAHVKPMH